jgi:hypothetical protein
MAAFRHRGIALALIAIASAAFVYAQQDPARKHAERRKQRPARERIKAAEGEKSKPGEPEKARRFEARQAPADKPVPPESPARKPPARERHQRLALRDAEVALIQMEHANPFEVLNVLKSMLGGERLGCHVLGGASLLIISDDETALQKVRNLVGKLDRPLQPARVKPAACVAVPLEHADADNVRRYLLELAPESLGKVRVVADDDANTVWVAGAAGSAEWLAELAERMDDNAAEVGARRDDGEPQLRFYSLTHADPVRLAQLVTHVTEAMGLELAVAPDPGSRTLVTYGTPDAHEYAQTIVDRLDQSGKPAVQEEAVRKERPQQRRPPAERRRGRT